MVKEELLLVPSIEDYFVLCKCIAFLYMLGAF